MCLHSLWIYLYFFISSFVNCRCEPVDGIAIVITNNITAIFRKLTQEAAIIVMKPKKGNLHLITELRFTNSAPLRI